MRVEIQMSGISDEYMRQLRRLVDRRPEIAVFLIEELMNELGLTEAQQEKVVKSAVTRWTEAGRS